MIDRRSLIALGAFMPVAGKTLRLDVSDPRLHPVNTGGVRIVGISPDASLLVGMGDKDTICILDATTREVVAESDSVSDLTLLDILAISWNPDGSHITFTTRPWGSERDSVLYVMDVTSGEIQNLTANENPDHKETAVNNQPANYDTSPVWLDDDRILFSRHIFIDKDIQTTLTLLTPSNGETETWMDLSPFDVLYVTSPLWKLTDGTLVFGTDGRRNERNVNIAMMVSPDGEIQEIGLGEGGGIRVIDANDTHLIAMDHAKFEYLYVPLDPTAETVDLWKHFNLPDAYGVQSDPKLGPEPNSVLVIAENDKDQTLVLQISESEIKQIAEVYRVNSLMAIDWVDDVILVTSDDGAWLIEPQES